MSIPDLAALRVDPLPCLLAWHDPALGYWARRDLLGDDPGPIEALWGRPEAARIVHKQAEDGAWPYPGKTVDPQSGTNYALLETYRNLRVLVEMYGFQRGHPAIEKAAGYLFSLQSQDGDLRGILGNQHMPYYHGAILELLVKAGYAGDPRLERGLAWLLSTRQRDGGWVVPAQTVPPKQRTAEFWQGEAVRAAAGEPSSHLATGMALRAFAAHPAYRQDAGVLAAARLLEARLFQPDRYGDRKAASYWLKFQYPFWWTSLLTALDSLSRLGFARQGEQAAKGLDWFVQRQSADGLWDTGYGIGKRAEENRRWVGLAACRVIQRFYGFSL